MAKGTIIKKGFVNIKERKYKNTHAELTRKLQSELESDLIRYVKVLIEFFFFSVKALLTHIAWPIMHELL